MISTASFHILLALSDEARHGYGIMQEIENYTQGKVKVGPGTLYRSIKEMIANQWIEETVQQSSAPHDEKRRYYQITKEGSSVLHHELQQMERVFRAAQSKGAFNISPYNVQEG